MTKLISHVVKCEETGNQRLFAACQVGCLVSSTRGRDYGRFYLVLGIEGDGRVWLADGEVRKVEKMKRKNIKHLRSYDLVAKGLAEKAESGKRITNVDVRDEIKGLVNQLCPQ